MLLGLPFKGPAVAGQHFWVNVQNLEYSSGPAWVISPSLVQLTEACVRRGYSVSLLWSRVSSQSKGALLVRQVPQKAVHTACDIMQKG